MKAAALSELPTEAEMKELDEKLLRIARRARDRQGPIAVMALNYAFAAMIDHETGARPGITVETWGRYVREIIEADDGLAACRVLNRLHSNAHWTPDASTWAA